VNLSLCLSNFSLFSLSSFCPFSYIFLSSLSISLYVKLSLFVIVSLFSFCISYCILFSSSLQCSPFLLEIFLSFLHIFIKLFFHPPFLHFSLYIFIFISPIVTSPCISVPLCFLFFSFSFSSPLSPLVLYLFPTNFLIVFLHFCLHFCTVINSILFLFVFLLAQFFSVFVCIVHQPL